MSEDIHMFLLFLLVVMMARCFANKILTGQRFSLMSRPREAGVCSEMSSKMRWSSDVKVCLPEWQSGGGGSQGLGTKGLIS